MRISRIAKLMNTIGILLRHDYCFVISNGKRGMDDMKTVSGISLSLVVLLLLSPAVKAQVVVWEATGTLTSVDTSGGFITEFPSAGVGSEFSLLVEYEASTPVTTVNSASDFGGGVYIGTRGRYNDALISISLFIDGVPLVRAPDGFNLLDIWDDFGFAGTPTSTTCFEPGVACDGFVTSQGLVSSQAGGFASIALLLRGTEFLDIYTDIALPVTPSPLLTSLSTTSFQFLDGTDAIIGNVDSVTRFVTPEVLLEELAEVVIDTGPGGSLLDKIELAQAYLAVPDVESACGVLGAFINQVNAQSGKKVPVEQAEQLIADAQAIRDAIGCD